MIGPQGAAAEQRDPREATGEKPEVIRIRLLGGFQMSVGLRTIERNQWRLRKAAGPIRVLALAPGHRLHRERVMDLLWPELSGRQQPAPNAPLRPPGPRAGPHHCS